MSKSLLSEISENVTLYHRSNHPMKVGDVVKPKRDEDGKHWLEHVVSEVGMEYYRKKHFPDKPSRLNCVYSAVIPRSRFVDKGNLYVVKPRGKIHVADSSIIDLFHESFDREHSDFERMRRLAKDKPEQMEWYIDHFSADRYWKGDGRKAKKENVEVLSDSAVVVEVIDDSDKRLQVNQVYEVTEDGVLLFWLHMYSQAYGHPTEQEMDIFTKLSKNLFGSVISEKGAASTESKGFLRKGLRIMPTRIRTAMTKGTDDVHAERGGEKRENLGKYREILLAIEIDGKWYRSYQEKIGDMHWDLKSHSFMRHYYKQPWDYGQYLKKV